MIALSIADDHVTEKVSLNDLKQENGLHILIKFLYSFPGEDAYKPYDLFSNPDTLFTM